MTGVGDRTAISIDGNSFRGSSVEEVEKRKRKLVAL